MARNHKIRLKPVIVGNNTLLEGRTAGYSCAVIQIEDVDGGFLTSRLTNAQRDTIENPVDGLMIWNLDSKQMEVYPENGGWGSITGATQSASNTVFGRSGNIVAQASDYDADQIDYTPDANLTSTDVQGAINELSTKVFQTVSMDDLTDVDMGSVAPSAGDYLSWDGNKFVPVAHEDIEPATTRGVTPSINGAIGTSDKYAREDHSHPMQGVSIDADNSLTVGSDGKHYYKGITKATELSDIDGQTIPSNGQVLAWSGTQYTPSDVSLPNLQQVLSTGSSLNGDNTITNVNHGEKLSVKYIYNSSATYGSYADITSTNISLFQRAPNYYDYVTRQSYNVTSGLEIKDSGLKLGYGSPVTGEVRNEISLTRNRFDMTFAADTPLYINGDEGTQDYVLTSQGANKPPVWKANTGVDGIDSVLSQNQLITQTRLIQYDTFGAIMLRGNYTSPQNNRYSMESRFTRSTISMEISKTENGVGSTGNIYVNAGTAMIAAYNHDYTAQNSLAFTTNSANLVLKQTDLQINNQSGTDGQVLTSKGAGNPPVWQSVAIPTVPKSVHDLDDVHLNGTPTFGQALVWTTNSFSNIPITLDLALMNDSKLYRNHTINTQGVDFRIRSDIGTTTTAEMSIKHDDFTLEHVDSGLRKKTLKLDGAYAELSYDDSTTSEKNTIYAAGDHVGLWIDDNSSLKIRGSAGNSGQVLMSQGNNRRPIWATVNDRLLSLSDVALPSQMKERHFPAWSTTANKFIMTDYNLDTLLEEVNTISTNTELAVGNNDFIINSEVTDPNGPYKSFVKVNLTEVTASVNTQNYFSTLHLHQNKTRLGYDTPVANTKKELVIDGDGFDFVLQSGSLSINNNAGTNGQVLTSTGPNTAPTWKTISGGASSLNDLSDVDTTTSTASTNDTLVYNGTAFTPGKISIDSVLSTGQPLSAPRNINYKQHSLSMFGDISDSNGTHTSNINTSAFSNELRSKLTDLAFDEYQTRVYTTSAVVGMELVTPNLNNNISITKHNISLTISPSASLMINGSSGTNGQVLTSTGPNSAPQWKTISSGGASALNDLSDVDTSTTPANVDDVLAWNGTNFVPSAPVSELDSLSDVDTSTKAPEVNDTLVFDATSNGFIPKKITPDVIFADTQPLTATRSIYFGEHGFNIFGEKSYTDGSYSSMMDVVPGGAELRTTFMDQALDEYQSRLYTVKIGVGLTYNTPNVFNNVNLREGGLDLNLATTSTLMINGASGTSGQVLTSNGPNATPQWKTISGGASSLNDLSDVDTSTTPANVDDVLAWDGSNYVPTTISAVSELNDLSDVDMTVSATGNTLVYDGNSYVPKTLKLADALNADNYSPTLNNDTYITMNGGKTFYVASYQQSGSTSTLTTKNSEVKMFHTLGYSSGRDRQVILDSTGVRLYCTYTDGHQTNPSTFWNTYDIKESGHEFRFGEGSDLKIDQTAGNVGDVLVSKGAGKAPAWEASAGAPISTVGTFEKNKINILDTRNAISAISPFANPEAGDRFIISDAYGNCATNNIVINFSTDKLHGQNDTYVVNENRAMVKFVYVDATIGWIIEH